MSDLLSRLKYSSSVLYRTGTFPTTEETLIWSAKNVEVSRWRKMIVELPNDIEEYRLLLEGEYKEASSHSRNYVTVDNLELRSCSVEGKLLLLITSTTLYAY